MCRTDCPWGGGVSQSITNFATWDLGDGKVSRAHSSLLSLGSKHTLSYEYHPWSFERNVMLSRIFPSENCLIKWYCRTSIAWSKPEEFNLAKTEDETDKPLTEQIPANIDGNLIARRGAANAVKQILWRILHNIQQSCKTWDYLYIKREKSAGELHLLSVSNCSSF